MSVNNSELRLQLARSMARLNHGYVERLVIKDGEPQNLGNVPAYKRARLDRPPLKVQVSHGKPALKKHHFRLFKLMDELQNGAISIKIQDGLPIHFAVVESS